MGKNQWVVHHDNKWAVKGEGNSRVTKTFNTQKKPLIMHVKLLKIKKAKL